MPQGPHTTLWGWTPWETLAERVGTAAEQVKEPGFLPLHRPPNDPIILNLLAFNQPVTLNFFQGIPFGLHDFPNLSLLYIHPT